MIVPLITVAEADTFNSLSADWLLLLPEHKEAHILSASLHMQSRFSCTGVLWDDPLTLCDDLKRACAGYAEADRKGALFRAVEQMPDMTPVEVTKKVGTLQTTTKWLKTRELISGNPLERLDAVMLLYCKRVSSAQVLNRV